MGLRAKEFPTTESDHFQVFKMLQSKTKCPLKKEKKYNIYIYEDVQQITDNYQLPKPTKTFFLITFLFIKLSNFTLNKIIIFYNNRTFNSKIGFCLR